MGFWSQSMSTSHLKLTSLNKEQSISEHLGQDDLSVENNLFSDCQGLVAAKNEMTPQNLFTSKLSGTLTAAKVSSLLNSSSQLLPRPNKCGLGLQSDTLVKDGAAFAFEFC